MEEAEKMPPKVITIEDSPVKLVVSPQYRYVRHNLPMWQLFYVWMFGFCLLFLSLLCSDALQSLDGRTLE